MKRSSLLNRAAGIIILVLIHTEARTQILNPVSLGKDLFPTPQAATIQRFGQIPVSLFNGLPQIDVPLYELKSRDITVPVSLKYHASGIKPNDASGIVGAGWGLIAGGAITRIQNGLPDELTTHLDVAPNPQIGYYYRHNICAASNWTDPYYMQTYLFGDNLIPPYGSDPNYIDTSPDEFMFNCNGVTGSFVLSENGVWKVKSNDGVSVNVKETLAPYQYSYSTQSQAFGPKLQSIFTEFTLTLSDGYKYFFGGTNSSIEFNRVGRANPVFADDSVIATSWYLTKILSPLGDSVVFHYVRNGYQIVLKYEPNGTAYSGTVSSGNLGGYISSSALSLDNKTVQAYIQDPVYLDGVYSSNGSVKLYYSTTNILDYPWGKNGTVNYPSEKALSDDFYNELHNQGASLTSTLLKLDSVSVGSNLSVSV